MRTLKELIQDNELFESEIDKQIHACETVIAIGDDDPRYDAKLIAMFKNELADATKLKDMLQKYNKDLKARKKLSAQIK